MKSEITLKELYISRTPFSIIESEEIGGRVYSIVMRYNGIKSFEIQKDEINYFFTIKKHAKKIEFGYTGNVYEFFDFKNKLGIVTRHQFVEALNRGIR
jgi:hypothetical protein